MTTSANPIRSPQAGKRIRAPRTPRQKIREIVLVLFDVTQQEIADATGAEARILTNIFRDRHRSPATEELVLRYLNGLVGQLSEFELKTLSVLTGPVHQSQLGRVTRELMGWPLSEREQ